MDSLRSSPPERPAFYCKGDVVEGSAPVQEPGTIFLLGIGLMANAGRKKAGPKLS